MRFLKSSKNQIQNVTVAAVLGMLHLSVWLYAGLLSSQYYLEKRLMFGAGTEDAHTPDEQGARTNLRRSLRTASLEGQALVEYALVVAVIAVVVIAILVLFGQNILKIFTKVNSTMCSDTGDC